MSMKIVAKTNKKITLTVDENLNKLQGKILAPRKLEEANRIVKNLKLPNVK